LREQGGAGREFAGVTDASGEFAALVLPGLYRITVTHSGFKTLEQPVEIATGQPTTLRLTLSIDAGAASVEVHAEGYKADDASSASRIPMTLEETPQQVEVLTGELMRARGAESMKQAVEMVPSVGLQLGEGRRDNFFIRGFNAVGDMYVDGMRDDAQYYRDLSNTDRIEVLEGPAAALYGRGSSGGLINRITKKPGMEGTLAELAYTSGSYGEQRGAADLDTLLPGTHRKLGLRLTGAAESEGSQRHFYWEDRYTFAPTLLWKPSDTTSVSAQVERLRDDRLPDRGIPYLPATGWPADVPVGNFYGYTGPLPGSNFIHSAVTDGTLDTKHVFQDGWNAHFVQRFAGYNTNFANMYPSAVTPIANGDYSVARGEYNGTQLWTNADTNVEAYRSGRWLGMSHTLLLGAEYGREATASTQYNGPANQTPVDLLNPAPTAPILSTVLSRNNRFLGQTYALYAQDLITLSARWRALVGVRVDDFRQTLELFPPTNNTPNLGRADVAASPRIGLVYQVPNGQARPWASLYGNYSRTFDPSGEGLSLATNNAQLKPEVTQNYEVGAKADLLRSRLLATASLFRLDRTNIKTTDPNNPLALLNLGEQRTDGAELDVQGSLARRWQLFGGYSWLDGRIVSSTTASNGVGLQGRRPAMSPLHGASVWTTYSFASGFGFSAGLVARAKQFASTDNLAALPAYAHLDASLFYRRARCEVQANVQNLGNLKYFDAAQSDYQIYPAAPINGSVTVRYRF
jgi:catecholate siderophore receptor